MYIGENIKRLRREKGITQETLAERMHVSTAAVSKWERGDTMPDISMLVPLASYFGVSTDEILGLDAAKNAENIEKYLNERKRLGAIGKVFEEFDLMKKAYEEYPNDWRIVEQYMWELQYDPNCKGPYGYQVHKDELYALCNRVLEECTLDQPRYSALSILSGLYLEDGNLEKALELSNRFPDYYQSKGEEIEGCYERGTDEWYKQLRVNIRELADQLQVKICNSALWALSESPAEQLRILKKAVALIELVYDEGDYGFYHYDLAELYVWIAGRYVQLDEFDTAFEYYEKGLEHARKFDELPKISTHTSFLVRGNVQDMAKISTSTEENLVARRLEEIGENPNYGKVKDSPKMREILAKYEPFAGKKI